MGCDIHLVIEHQPFVGYARGDAEIRALKRALEVDPADGTLLAKLKSYEIHTEAWEPACIEFSTSREDLGPELARLVAQHSDRVSCQGGYRYYSVAPDFAYTSGRNYGAFFWLTGTVRGEGRGVTPVTCGPRGFPKDSSAYAAELYDVWDGDAHSASWLLCSELVPCLGGLEPARASDYRDMVLFWSKALRPEHVRFTFWFDN